MNATKQLFSFGYRLGVPLSDEVRPIPWNKADRRPVPTAHLVSGVRDYGAFLTQ